MVYYSTYFMKENPDPAEIRVDVSRMQRSRAGNVLLRVKGKGLETPEKKLREYVAKAAELATIERKKVSVEIRGMNFLEEVEDVQKVPRAFFSDEKEKLVFVTAENRRGTD